MLFCFWWLVSGLLWRIWFTLFSWEIVYLWVFAMTALFFCRVWLSDYFPSSGCCSPLAKPFPLFLSPGWFSWQHRWPCPGVLWVLQHLLQWRQRPHGGAAQKTRLPRAWHGECTLTQTLFYTHTHTHNQKNLHSNRVWAKTTVSHNISCCELSLQAFKLLW